MHLGGANSKYESKLLLSGGKYEHGYDTFNLNKNGTVEIADGELVLYNPFKANGTAENSKVILRGGKLDATSDRLFNGDGSATVHVDGHGTIALPWGTETLDVIPYTDSVNESTACRWTCTPGSILSIPGHTSGRLGVFTMHNFAADGLVFDLNVRKTQVVLEGLGEAIGLGWVLPGASVAKVTAANAAAGGQPVTTLNPSYVVPSGQTFDAGNPPTGWYEGFVEGSLQNLTFEEGSTFLFPYFGSGAALALGGKLTLPSAANYRVDAQGPKTKVENATILTAADGIDGDCTWTCVGGISRKSSQLVTEGDSLLFSYDPLGALLILR